MTDEFEYNICAHLQNARCNSNAQYKAALAAERVHYIVGLPAIVLGTLVSTSIFASLDSSPDAAETIVVGAVGLLASALAATQTFFNYSAEAQAYRAAGAQYGDVRRRCEFILYKYHLMTDEDEKQVFATQEYAQPLDRLADLTANSPDVPNKYWDAAKRENDQADRDAAEAGASKFDPCIPPRAGESSAS
jgi:hypothetical protein